MGNGYEEYLKTLGSKYNIPESGWSVVSKPSEQSSASGFSSGSNQSSYESYIAGLGKKYGYDYKSESKPLGTIYIPTSEEMEVNRYFSDYTQFIQDYGNRLSSIGWSDGISANSELRDSISGFTARDQNIRKYLEDNRFSLNPDYYNEVVSGLDSAAEAMRLLQDVYDQNALYFGQFGSQEEYDAATMDASGLWGKMHGNRNLDRDISWAQDLIDTPYDRATYELAYGNGADAHDIMRDKRQYFEDTYGIRFGSDYEQNAQAMQALLEQLEGQRTNGDGTVAYTTEDGQNVTWESLYDYRWAQENDTGEKRLQWYKDAQDKLAQLKQNRGSQAEIAALEARIRMYETGETNERGVYYGSKVLDDYSGLRSNADFGSVSANRSYINPTREELDAYDASQSEGSVAIANGGSYDDQGNIRNARGEIVRYADAPAVEDKLGMFLSASYEEIAEANNILSVSVGNYETTWADIIHEGDVNRWRFLKPEEIETYYYLLGSQGQDAAYKYLDDMEIELGRRETIQDRETIDAATGWEKLGYNLLSLPMNLVGGAASTIDSASRFLTGRQFNPYSRAQTATQLGGYIRGSTAQDIDELTGGAALPILGYTFGDAYQAAMSGVDSALGVALFGSGYTKLMGMGAAANEAVQLYSQGASTDQIASGALAAGVAEWVFEKYSVENLINMSAPKTFPQFLKNVLIQGGIEFTEEGFTEIANILSNGLIMQSQSDWQRVLDENGGDYGKAIAQMAIQVTNAGLSGFISGSGSAVATQAGTLISNKADESRIRDYAGAALTDFGETENVEEIAAAIGRQVMGRKLSDRDIALISGSENAQNILQMLGAKPVVTSEEVNATAQRLVNLGMGNAQAQVTAEKLLSAGKNYGKQSNIFVENYIPGQSVDEYRLGFDQLYTMGLEGMNKSLMDQYGAGLQQSQKEIAYSAGRDAASQQAKAIVADDFDLSDSGKPIQRDTGKEIQLGQFDSTDSIRVGDGSVKISNIAFGNYDDAVLYTTVSRVSSSAGVANQMIAQFRNSNLSAIDFSAGLMEAYEAGQIGEKTALELKDAEFAGKLTTGQREVVYNRGKRAAYQQAYQRQQDVKKKSGGEKEGKLHFDREGRKFDSVRESSLAVMDTLSKALGVDIYVFESYINEQGKRVYMTDQGEKKAPNGFYDPTDGSIHIDLNAGQDGRGTMLFTVAHELTHFIKDWSSVKYRVLADALVKQYQKRGVTVSELVDNQIAKAKQNGREISRQEAFDEVVADSLESMLADENAAAFLERLAQRDKGLKEKIVSWLKDLAAKLKNALSAYKDVKPDSPEGKMVAEMEDFRKEIMGIYTSALVDAGENFRENGGNKSTTREGDVKNSVRETDDGIKYVVLDGDIFVDNNGNPLSPKKAYNALVGKQIVLEDGDVITFVKNLPGIEMYKELFKKYPGYDGSFDIVGINWDINKNILDVVSGSTVQKRNEPQRHYHYGISDFDQRQVFITDGNEVYRLELNIANLTDGKKVAYVKRYIEKADYETAQKIKKAETAGKTRLNQPSDTSIRNPEPVVNKKFSDRDPTAEATRAALEKENGKLREDVSRLRELLRLQGKVTGGTVMKPSSVEAAAKWLNKYAGAKADVKELSRMLTDFYRFIATEKDYSWEDVQQRAMVIARFLQDNVQIKPQMSDYARDVLKEIRSTKVTLDDQQIAEVEHLYGSYEAFRKAALGSVMLVKEGGLPLDNFWHELNTLFPGTFDENVASNDQPAAMLDVVDAMRNSDTTAIEYAYNREAIAADLARAVYDSYWRVDALVTVADRNRKQVNELRAKHIQKMEEIKASHDKMVSDLKKKREKDLKQLRTDYRKKLADARTQYQESREKAVESRNKTKMRERIKKTVNELNHLLLNGDKKRHVPEGMRAAVADILSAVNMETSTEEARSARFRQTVARYNQRIRMENNPEEKARLEAARDAYIGKGDQFKSKMEALRRAYDEIRSSSDPELQDAYSEAVSQYLFTLEAQVGDTSLREMNLSQLQTVNEVLTIVMNTIRNANKSFLNERAGTIEQQAKAGMGQIRQAWKTIKAIEHGPGRLLRGFHYRNLKPVYLMRTVGSQAMMDAYNNLRKGEDTWYRDVADGRKFFLETARKYGYQNWDFEKTYTFSDNSGGEINLTLGQMLSLYAYAKREAAAEHLRIGGVVMEGEAVRTNKLRMKVKYYLNDATTHQLGPEALGQIIGKLSKEQAAFADAMQDYLSTVMGTKGNEVSMAMYGIKLFREKNYFPIQSAKQFVDSKNEPVGEIKLKNSGFTNKVVPKANNPMILRSFMDVWSEHVNQMASYHSFVLAIEDFNRIFNYQTGRSEDAPPSSVKQTIQNYMGRDAVSAIRELIQSVNGGARVDPAASGVSKLISKFKKNAVLGSLSVVIQQPSAIVRATALIDPRHFVGQKITREKLETTWDTIVQYAPVAGIKEMGYFDTNMGKATSEYIQSSDDGILTRLKRFEKGSLDDLLAWAPGFADKVTWCAIWEAVKRETAGRYPNLGPNSEAFLKHCGERFTEVITQTQVYDSVFARSGNMRSNDKLMGMITAFMAEPTTNVNMLYDAFIQGKRGDKRYAAKAIGAVFGAAILNAVLKSFAYAERDDDEDETFSEKYVSALASALWNDVVWLVPNSIPFVRDIMSLKQGYDVTRTDMTMFDDLFTAIRKLGSETATTKDKVLGIISAVGNFALPAKNLIREVEALYSTIQNALRNRGNTTAYGLTLALREGFTGKTESNGSQLYEARVRGDTAHEERVTARYENENAANSAVVQEIGRRFKGGLLSREEAVDHLGLYAGKTESEAYWMVREWAYAAEHGGTDGYSKYNDLYDAILSGGDITESVLEFTGHGIEEDSVMTNLKTQVGRWYYDSESEIRIDESQARDILSRYFGMKPGEIDEVVGKWNLKKETGISFDDLHEAMSDGKLTREEAVEYLQRYGGLTGYDAEERVEGWEFEDAHGYAYSDIKSTYLDEEITAEETLAVLVEIGGKTQEDARKLMREWDYEAETGVNYSDKASQYRRGIITRQELRAALMDLGGYSGEDADLYIEAYDWQNDGYQGASFARVKSWHEYCEPAGVSRDMWLKIALYSANTENDKREDGSSINYSAMKKVMAEIHKLPISRDQKTAIARALGWSERNIARYKPW